MEIKDTKINRRMLQSKKMSKKIKMKTKKGRKINRKYDITSNNKSNLVSII